MTRPYMLAYLQSVHLTVSLAGLLVYQKIILALSVVTVSGIILNEFTDQSKSKSLIHQHSGFHSVNKYAQTERPACCIPLRTRACDKKALTLAVLTAIHGSCLRQAPSGVIPATWNLQKAYNEQVPDFSVLDPAIEILARYAFLACGIPCKAYTTHVHI
jgi:hypothetical protein